MSSTALKDIVIGSSNCRATCNQCHKHNIFYVILDKRFFYYCLECKKWLSKGGIDLTV
jgi:hypothetical protein